MSLFKQLAGETVIYGLSHVLGKVLNYVLIAFYLTRKLSDSPAEYGIYNELYFYVALLLIILGLRMETTFFRFGSQKGQSSQAFSNGVASVLSSGLLWFLPAIIFADDIAAWISYPDKSIYIQVLSALLLVDLVIAMPLAKLRLARRPLAFAFYQLGGIVLNVLLVLFFLEWCPFAQEKWGGVWSGLYFENDLLLNVFLANLIARAIILLLISKHIVGVQWAFNYSLWKKMLAYAWPLVLVGLAGVINQSSYIVLQKYFLAGSLMENLSTGGVYAAAAKIALLMNIFVTAYNFAAEPFFFGQSHRKDAAYIYAEMARAFAWVASVILLGILLYLDLFQFIVDESFRSVMYVVPIILVGYFFLGLYYNIAIWYKVKDKTIFGALISTVGTIITLVISLYLLPSHGEVGSAWAAMACYAGMTILCYLIGRKYFKVPYHLISIIGSLALAFVFYFISLSFAEWTTGIGMKMLINSVIFAIFITTVLLVERKKIKEWLNYR